MYTVELLLERFSDFTLLTNTNTHKEVTSVSVMDAPDIQRWMKGGEFLITSGFTLATRTDEFEKLIKDLHQRDIAALGIKVSRFVNEVPKVVLSQANELDLTIIEIPEHYAFTDIITPILSEIVNSNYNQLALSEEINRKFLQIGVADISYDKILNLLSKYLNSDIYYLDLESHKIYSSKCAPTNIVPKDLLDPTFTPIDVKYQRIHYGILYVQGDLTSFQDRMAITHAITMFRLSIQSLLSSKRHERQRRNDFLSELVLNHIKTQEEIDFRSQEYGWRLHDGVFCTVFHLDPKKNDFKLAQADLKHTLLDGIKTEMKKSCKDCYYIIFSNYIVFLIVGISGNSKKDEFISLCDTHFHTISSDEYAVTAGIGNSYPDIIDAHKSYSEAIKAVRIGRSMYGIGRLYEYSDLSMYDAILELTGDDLDKIPCLKIINMLNQMDKDHHTEFIATLAALIESDWIMSEACKKVFVHYNTMKYRVAKIRELSNWSFIDREEKFQIEYAYKVFIINEKSKVQAIR